MQNLWGMLLTKIAPEEDLLRRTTVRLLADVVWETYRDPLLAPEPPGARGLDHEPAGAGTYVSFLARIQFQVP